MTLPDSAHWARLSAWFDELVVLADPARQARLTALERIAPETVAELRRMLAADGQARVHGFLTGAALPQAPAQEPVTRVGQRLGAYVLAAPIGQGGSGSVWRARREDGRFEGEVAIKLLHLSLLGQSGAERFRREGSILARLTHPHIARLLDAGITPEGQPYLVIELVRGERLDRHCDAMNLDTAARLRLFSDVLQAVAHAHGHLVVHRDIKPSNILVTPDGTVKLLDFGIAKLLQDEDTEGPTTDLTRDWGRVMTPEYAAPEQLRGDPVTTATDVYALGVLLYELLTGQLPFPDRRRGTARLLLPDGDPGRPSTRVTEPALQRRLAGDLDTIVLRALKAEPTERYTTVSALLDDITRHLGGQPVLARGDAWPYRLRKWVGRHRAGSAVMAGVALALVGGAHAQVAVLMALAVGTLLALWQARAARAQAQAAQAAQRRAEKTQQFIASIFTEARPRDGSGGVVTALALLASATQRIEAELAATPGMAGELGALVGDSCSRLGDLKLGLQALDAAVPRCRRALGDTHPTTLNARVLQLEALNGVSQFQRARTLAPALLADLRCQLPAQLEGLVFALQETSFAQAKLNDVPASLAPLREAVALAEAHLGPAHELTLESLGLLSNTLGRFAQHAEALPPAKKAMDRAQQTLGHTRPHSQLTQTERWYADALVNNGRPGDAEPIARQVVLDQQALDGEVTRRVVNAMAAHSMALAGMGRTEDAVALARDVVARHAAWSEEADEDAASFSYRLAFCLLPTRRVDETRLEIDRGEALKRQLGIERPLDTLRRQRMRAQLLAWQGQGDAARALLDGLEDSTRTEHPLEWTRLAFVRALTWRLQGEGQAGLSAAHDAIERCTETDAPALDRAHAYTERGLLLLESGTTADATAALEQAARLYQQAQVQPSVLNGDALLGLGRLHLLAGRQGPALELFSQVEALWARSHPGSRWHRQAQEWVDQACNP
jgi:eukaryotic-like serine/threonine-protein kinase